MKVTKFCALTAMVLAVPARAIAHPGHGLPTHEMLLVAEHAAPWLIALTVAACALKLKAFLYDNVRS